jgi:hypothetical protein
MGPQTQFWGTILFLSPQRTPKTLELLSTVVRFAIAVEMRFKHALACSRAIDYSPQVQPMIPTPGHGSLPSGHSTQAYIVAGVMAKFFDDLRKESLSGGAVQSNMLRTQLYAQARRVAVNRTIAGVHFPVDTAAGHLLGTTLAEYFVHRCDIGTVRKTYVPRVFRGENFDGTKDFSDQEPLEWQGTFGPPPANSPKAVPDYQHIEIDEPRQTRDGSRMLAWLWKQATNEWNGNSLKANRA